MNELKSDREILKEPTLAEEVISIIRQGLPDDELRESLNNYHDNDLAEAFELIEPEERVMLFHLLGAEKISEILAYIEDANSYIQELNIQDLASIITEMDADDAVDFLEDVDDATRAELRDILDEKTTAGIDLIRSYDEDEIGSIITTNYILIENTLTIRQAMHELVRQAEDNDNISTIYVNDKDGHFYGAIDLTDLIVAREYVELESLISTAYPYVTDHEMISECIERIKDYAEDSLPVLNEEHKMIGIITAQNLIEVVDDELGDDYAKLAGLTAEEDLHEKTIDSVKKRLPWLLILLVLGIGVSTVVGVFEGVVAAIPLVIAFQSLILDMSGNVGTQSLAVTIRVLMDESLTPKDKFMLALKEMRLGFVNGLLLGSMAFVFLGLYVYFFKHYDLASAFLVSGCVGVSLILAMVISGLVGTLIPMFFHKIKVDPAVASGPLITTINDLVAVVTYYGLAYILLIQIFPLN